MKSEPGPIHSDDPLRVLLVDDDPMARRRAARLLKKIGAAEVVGEAADAREAIAAVHKLNPDVVLLDIEMPGDDGFSVADALEANEAPYIIFLTAYDRYAVEAFQHKALDYVLKPAAPDRLAEALERARAQRDARKLLLWATGVQSAIGEGSAPGDPGSDYLTEIMVRVAMRDVLVQVNEIDWIEADSYYARLHVGAKEYLLREPLQALESRLHPERFVRVHRSAIVNIKRVREVRYERTGERVIVLSTGARVRVSRNRWRDFSLQLRDRTRVTPPHNPA
ncbi:MAG: LytTR family DNA-binding domain-containing protein [Gemmatimonadetes bacterium]|nr:LytTR family DNA-binding domain-containing protein [Gemmatimonadota bacterium]